MGSGFRIYENFFTDLNQAFKEELEFSFQNFIDVLQVLTYWPDYAKESREHSFYCAPIEEIGDVCLSSIENLNNEKLIKIIDFLTLKKNDVTRLLGVREPCNDLPVWEYRKRFSRYTIRPLLFIDNGYYWGSYSSRMTRLTWSNRIIDGALPTDLQCEKISVVLEKQKNFNEKKIVETAFDFISNYTSFIERDLFLHNRIPDLIPPLDLGDYDILAFIQDKDLVLNIECKDILPAYCLKDAKRLREKVFGRDGKSGGHLKQIRKRQDYLVNNLETISNILGWNISSDAKTTVIPIHLSTRLDWFTFFPPEDVEVQFLAIQQLHQYLDNLSS